MLCEVKGSSKLADLHKTICLCSSLTLQQVSNLAMLHELLVHSLFFLNQLVETENFTPDIFAVNLSGDLRS